MHGPSSVVQESAQRIPNSGPSAVSNVERPGGVGRYKLNLNAFAFTFACATKACSSLENIFHNFQITRLGDVEINESGACDIALRNNGVLWYALYDCGG